MNMIELEKWIPSHDDPGKLKYAGQRTAAEVFQELKYRLESMGYLPDEYFLMDTEWGNGREIPKGADIYCVTDYGASEGVYLDVYLKWYENDQPVTKSFITGKTLRQDGAALDRMHLIASAITKAFHGGEQTQEVIMSVTENERDAIIQALAAQRERQSVALDQTEQLIRRMTGSITEYMDLVGTQPMRLSEYDKAVLAIRDGNLGGYKEAIARIDEQEALDDLLMEAAGRPGMEGRKMTILLLSGHTSFSTSAYETACRRAVDISDYERTVFLLEQAAQYTPGFRPEFWGELAYYAYGKDYDWHMATQIMKDCPSEAVAAAPKKLLRDSLLNDGFDMSKLLAGKGINADQVLPTFIERQGDKSCWELKVLLDLGMKVSPDNYEAMLACVEHSCPEIGKLLIHQGMDYGEFEQWTMNREEGFTANETSQTLKEFWDGLQTQQQEQSM